MLTNSIINRTEKVLQSLGMFLNRLKYYRIAAGSELFLFFVDRPGLGFEGHIVGPTMYFLYINYKKFHDSIKENSVFAGPYNLIKRNGNLSENILFE